GEEYPDEGLPFEQIKEKGEPVYDVRHAIEWPDGERKLFSINAAPLYDEDGNFDGMVATIDDVTEEVEKTRELEESRRRLKTLMDNIPGIAYRCLNDRDWTMKFISDGCEELTGYDPEEFIGEEGLVFADIIHPEDRDYIWREVQNAAEEERPYELEYRIETSDGEERWVWEQGEVVDSGEEEFLEGMIMDINERKRMEKRVKRERDRAQRYLETAEVMMVTIDPKGKVIQANKKACEVLGCDKEEIIGEDWFENFIPKDQREELRGTHGGFIERGEIEDGYHGNPVITKDGEEKMVEWSNNIIRDEGGEVIGTLSSGRDITEAEKRREEVKRSEERYRRLFESAQDGILILDVDTGVIKDANPYIQDILGYSEEELIGKKIWEIGGFHNIAEDKKKFEELVGKGYVRYDDLPLRSKEGREVPVEFISNTYEVKGEIVAQCNIREISERKKVEEREEYLHSLLRHDIKNKVQLIDGYFSLLEDTDLPEEARSSVEKGKNMTKNTMDLIEKVRKLRELGEEEIIEVDMNSVLSSVLSNYEKQMKSEGIDVDVERVECRVKGGSLLEEVFHNLIENSIRHSNCSELSIQIKEIEDECRVIFEDDGKGIPDDVKEKIFDKGFKKGENAGSGLGMYLAKEIVESYGGSVEVKDSEMGGARFDVRLKKI
ncbi:MAG: PAS domain S-box protein, partial [Candidatus Natronoplasma sp.]